MKKLLPFLCIFLLFPNLVYAFNEEEREEVGTGIFYEAMSSQIFDKSVDGLRLFFPENYETGSEGQAGLTLLKAWKVPLEGYENDFPLFGAMVWKDPYEGCNIHIYSGLGDPMNPKEVITKEHSDYVNYFRSNLDANLYKSGSNYYIEVRESNSFPAPEGLIESKVVYELNTQGAHQIQSIPSGASLLEGKEALRVEDNPGDIMQDEEAYALIREGMKLRGYYRVLENNHDQKILDFFGDIGQRNKALYFSLPLMYSGSTAGEGKEISYLIEQLLFDQGEFLVENKLEIVDESGKVMNINNMVENQFALDKTCLSQIYLAAYGKNLPQEEFRHGKVPSLVSIGDKVTYKPGYDLIFSPKHAYISDFQVEGNLAIARVHGVMGLGYYGTNAVGMEEKSSHVLFKKTQEGIFPWGILEDGSFEEAKAKFPDLLAENKIFEGNSPDTNNPHTSSWEESQVEESTINSLGQVNKLLLIGVGTIIVLLIVLFLLLKKYKEKQGLGKKYCRNCGNKIDSGNKFCVHCGRQILP